ncbi:MAG: hypothetical protein QNK03_02325 [Myxococcota bacterium]|nr:hypothetical protein [Myxococcota bacterium]
MTDSRVCATAGAGLATLAVCLAVVVATPGETYWIADCGNKALQAGRLLESGFARLDFDAPAAAFDPEGAHFPIPPPYAVTRADGSRVSVWPPSYAALAAPFLAAFGPRGLRVPAALAVAACAALLTAWLLPVLGTRRAFAAGLMLAVATPLLFYGVTVWEHAVTVALGLGGLLAASGASRVRLAAAGLCIGVAFCFREDLALLGAGLAVAVAWRTRSPGAVLALAAGAAPAVIAWLAFNASVYGALLGPHVAGVWGTEPGTGPDGGTVAGPIEWLRGLAGHLGALAGGRGEALLLSAALSVSLGLGLWLGGRASTRRPLAAVLAAVGLCAWALAAWRLGRAEAPLSLLPRHNGLFVHLPLAALAGVGLRRVLDEPRWETMRTGLLASGVFLALALALGATVPYSYGVHWGPRTLLPAVPALVALAWIACHEAGRAGTLALGLVAAAGLAGNAWAVTLLDAQKREGLRLQQALLELAPPVLVTTHPLLAQQLAGLWHRVPTLLASDAGALAAMPPRLRSAGAVEFALVVPPGAGAGLRVPGARCERVIAQRGARVHYLDLDVQHCRLAGVRGQP